MRNALFALAAVGVGAAGAAVYWHNQPPKLPIEQEFVLKPSHEGMFCQSDQTITACSTEVGVTIEGLQYEKVAFATDQTDHVIYMLGRFRRDQFEDAQASFVSHYGKPDDTLGDAGDRRGIWFLKNGVAVIRERATKVGEGSSAFSLFCFQGNDKRVQKEIGDGCKKAFKPSAV